MCVEDSFLHRLKSFPISRKPPQFQTKPDQTYIYIKPRKQTWEEPKFAYIFEHLHLKFSAGSVIMRWKPKIFPWNVPKWNVLLQSSLPYFFFCYFFWHKPLWLLVCPGLTKQLSGKCCLHLPPREPKVDKDMGLWQHQKNIVKSFFHPLTRATVKFPFSHTNSSRDLWNAIEFVNIQWSSI